jgi:hypothetical protein
MLTGASRLCPDIGSGLTTFCSYSKMVLHGFGKAESQVQFLLGAPSNKPIPTPDVTRVPGLSFFAAVAHQVEQQTENLCVAGSSPARGTIQSLS